MERRVTIDEATAHFADLLHDVQGGESVVVEEGGRAVARVVPVQHDRDRQREGIERLLQYFETLPIRDVGNWRRDDLYER